MPDELPFDIWEKHLRRACRERSSAQWRIGDLLNFGEVRYGNAYRQAIEMTGLSYQRLANIKTVAKSVEISRRRESLSFGHHAEVAALDADEQDRLLDLAEKGAWTRAGLREEVGKTHPKTTTHTIVARVTSYPPISLRAPEGAMKTVTYTPVVLPPMPAAEVEVKPVVIANPARYRDEVHSAPISVNVIGRGGDTTASHMALRELIAWEDQRGTLFDAITADLVRRLRQSIERQIAGATSEPTPAPTPVRPRFH